MFKNHFEKRQVVSVLEVNQEVGVQIPAREEIDFEISAPTVTLINLAISSLLDDTDCLWEDGEGED